MAEGLKLFCTGTHSFELLSADSLVAAYSDRTLDPEGLFETLGIPAEDRFVLEQIHGANIVLAKKTKREVNEFTPRADGVITRSKGIALSVYTADCCALFFYDPIQEAIGIAHVGWRGALARLPEKIVQALCHNFRSRAQNLLVGLSPHIRSCCYEVGEDLEALFDGFVERSNGKRFLDLTQVILSQLLSVGVLMSRVEDSRQCTYCENHLFYSSRREGRGVNRFTSLILLR